MIYYHWIFANRCKSKYIHSLNSQFNNSINIRIPTNFSQRILIYNKKHNGLN
jgi:hypothetical protein